MRTLALLCTLLGFSHYSAACNLDGHMGFGHLRGFSQAHPLVQNRMAQFTPRTFKVSHPDQLTVAAEQAHSIKIDYVLPTTFTDVTMRVTHGFGIALAERANIELTGAKGSYDLSFTPAYEGRNHITLWIDAMQGSLPYSKVQRIAVVVE